MEIQTILISPFLIVFSLGMMITSLLSYQRTHNTKLIFVGLMFMILLFRGILLALTLLPLDLTIITSPVSFSIMDLVILLLLFLATIKR